MAHGFTYDPPTLSKASNDLKSGSAAVEAELGRLARGVAPLEGAFKGQAGDNFRALFAEWERSGKQLKASLEGLSQMLSTAAQNAQQMEDANARMMRG